MTQTLLAGMEIVKTSEDDLAAARQVADSHQPLVQQSTHRQVSILGNPRVLEETHTSIVIKHGMGMS